MMLDPRTWPFFRRYPTDDPAKIELATNADFKALFQTPAGARVLAQIMHEAEMFRSTLSKNRVDRDMIDGKRELAMTIFERAGFEGERMPFALMTDNLRNARPKENDDERNRNDRNDYEPAPEPVFDLPLGDD